MKRHIKADSESSAAISGKELIGVLDTLDVGTPLLVNAGTGDYVQAIYKGTGEIQYRTAYMFYDGSGISGTFGLSKRFILDNPEAVSIILDNNDPTQVSKLLKEIKGATSMRRKFRVDASKKIQAASLDERFVFEFDPEFNIYLDTSLAQPVCRVDESKIIGNGAGMTYEIIISIPSEEVHWQIREDIERNLERYIQEQIYGSDYTGSVISVEDDGWDGDDRTYRATVDIVPYQNISPWGEYGIDYGTEEYLDHVTKGTPFPPEYE